MSDILFHILEYVEIQHCK